MSGGTVGGGGSAGQGWISKAFAPGCKTEHCSGIPGSKIVFSHIALMALKSILVPLNCLSDLVMCMGCFLLFNFFQSRSYSVS